MVRVLFYSAPSHFFLVGEAVDKKPLSFLNPSDSQLITPTQRLTDENFQFIGGGDQLTRNLEIFCEKSGMGLDRRVTTLSASLAEMHEEIVLIHALRKYGSEPRQRYFGTWRLWKDILNLYLLD